MFVQDPCNHRFCPQQFLDREDSVSIVNLLGLKLLHQLCSPARCQMFGDLVLCAR